MKTPKKISTLLALATAVAMLWHFEASADTANHYQPNRMVRAAEALEHNRPDRTLAMLQGWVEKQRTKSRRAEGHSLMCRAYFLKRDFAKAEEACDAAVLAEGEERNWSHLNNRGVMRLMLGQLNAALDDFQEAAELKPRASAVRKNAVIAEREQRNLEQSSARVEQRS